MPASRHQALTAVVLNRPVYFGAFILILGNFIRTWIGLEFRIGRLFNPRDCVASAKRSIPDKRVSGRSSGSSSDLLEADFSTTSSESASERNCRFARQNEAALRRTLSRARSKRHRRFETRSLAELSVSRYDEAIVS